MIIDNSPLSPVKATVQFDGCTCTMTLAGVWFLDNGLEVFNALKQVTKARCQQLVVDCRELRSDRSDGLDSAFVATMVQVLKYTRRQGIKLTEVIFSTESCTMYFRMAKLELLFPFTFLDQQSGLTDHAA